MKYQKINLLTGWSIWLIATVVYLLTIEPTSSFWDCGEFIASAFKLEVGHPPGAPLFMMLARMFSMLAPTGKEAMAVNILSALCSSFTILFLFWTITHFAKKIATKSLAKATELSKTQVGGIMLAGAIGALAYTFSDSFWFSAVEGEVYAMSSLFTALVFWAILRWEALSSNDSSELRWIILIAYLMGLSIGVHLLNLLAIPAIAFVYYFKKYQPNIKGIIITTVVSLVVLGFIQSGIIRGFVLLAAKFELFFVNNMGAGFNTGVLVYAVLVISLISFILWFTQKRGYAALNTIALGTTMLLIGYSTFALIVVRSAANPPMDENNPENIFSLLSYLNREQYGDRPLLFGQYFNTPTIADDPYQDGAKTWVKSYSVRKEGRGRTSSLIRSYRSEFEAKAFAEELGDKHFVLEEYIDSGEKRDAIPNYDPEYSGFFPRMYSSSANHIAEYKQWSNYKGWQKTRVYFSPFTDQMMDRESFAIHLDLEVLGNGKSKAELERDLNKLFRAYKHKPSDFFTVASANEIVVKSPGSSQQQSAVLNDEQVRYALTQYLTDVLSEKLTEGRAAVQSKEALKSELERAVNELIMRANQTRSEEDRNRAEFYQKQLAELQKELLPSYGEDFRYFMSYQVNWMYFRYFMWNFAGKQNDLQGHKGFIDGNWLTGLNFIDEERLGNRDEISQQQKDNKGFNRYYYLPLLLGLIGLIFQLLKTPKDFSVTALLFLLTGLAIVVYLNQYPLQPRERDYAYVGSFYAFAIWIGLGAYALFDAVNLKWKDFGPMALLTVGTGIVLLTVENIVGDDNVWSLSILYMSGIAIAAMALMKVLGSHSALRLGAAGLICIIVPGVMAADGWDDHSRAKRRTGVDFAKNYLDSLEPNAIIFTNGDNDTFPLWYVQEVEGYRTDVRVVNLSLLNTDWYADQMKRAAYESAPVPFSVPEYQYRQGTRDVVLLNPPANRENPYVDLSEAMKVATDDNMRRDFGDGKSYAYLPSYALRIPVDSAAVVNAGVVAPEDADQIVDAIEWTITDGGDRPKSYLLKNHFLVLDLLNNNDWSRPIYFAVTTGPDSYIGLNQYFRLEGLAYRFVPIKYPENRNPNVLGGFASDLMYEKIMNDFQWGGMDDVSGSGVYMDENNRRMSDNLRLQFSNLAEQLIEESKNKKALNVLDKIVEITPEKNLPYDRIMLPIIESLYELSSNDTLKTGAAINSDLSEEDRARAKELADQVGERLFRIFEDETEYYLSLDPKYYNEIVGEVGLMKQINERIQQVLSFYHPEDPRVKEWKDRLKTMSKKIEAKEKGVTVLDDVEF